MHVHFPWIFQYLQHMRGFVQICAGATRKEIFFRTPREISHACTVACEAGMEYSLFIASWYGDAHAPRAQRRMLYDGG